MSAPRECPECHVAGGHKMDCSQRVVAPLTDQLAKLSAELDAADRAVRDAEQAVHLAERTLAAAKSQHATADARRACVASDIKEAIENAVPAWELERARLLANLEARLREALG